MPNDEETLLGSLEQKLGKITEVVEERTVGEEVTSIVYTDEGGREQSLVGKIVYQTDEAGQSNIIIQEVEPRHMLLQQGGKGKKLMRIDLGDMEGYMMAGAGQGEEEALEQRLEEELEGNEARLEEELDLQVASEAAAGSELKENLKFHLGEDQRVDDNDIGKGIGAGSYNLQQHREDRPIVASLQGVIQTSGIPARLPTPTTTQSSVTAVRQHGAVIQISEPAAMSNNATSLGDNMLKIQYKEYDQKILSAEMRPLMSQAELCDTVLVCRFASLDTTLKHDQHLTFEFYNVVFE